MEIRYRPTTENVIHAMRATSQPRWAIALFVLLLGLMFLIGIFLVDRDLGLIGWVWLGASVVLGISVYQIPQRQAWRALAKNPSAQEDIILNLTDSGIDTAAATGTSQTRWNAYSKFKETQHVFILSSDYGRSIFIPKRAMSPQQVEELRELLRKHLRKQHPTPA